jgi:hypothetical protein
MAINVSDYIDVESRAAELGCRVPAELALLPRNFDSADSKADLLYDNSADTVRKLLREAGARETPLETDDEEFSTLDNKAFEVIAPVLFVSAMLMTNNPGAVSIATGVMSNFATDLLRGVPGARSVKLDVIVQKPDKTCKKVKYDGPVNGLAELPPVLHEVFHDER